MTTAYAEGGRGAKLWLDLSGDVLPPGQRVLLEEACRIADRLDKLDRMLAGDATDWIGLVEKRRGDPEVLEVTIDRPLAEARQQQLALKQLLAEMRAMSAVQPPLPPAGAGAEEVGGDDDLGGFTPARSTKPAA